MRYQEFFTRFEQAHRDWGTGRIDTAAAAIEIARLRTVVLSVEQADREMAEYVLAQFEAEISPEAQGRMARAAAAVSTASSGHGTVDERIGRAEAGISMVTAIAAEATDPSEQVAILRMTSTLAKMIFPLQQRQRADGR